MQIYLLLISLLLPPSLPPSLPSLLLACPPSLALKIDSPSISSAPALSLANCIDGERKTEVEEAEREKRRGLIKGMVRVRQKKETDKKQNIKKREEDQRRFI